MNKKYFIKALSVILSLMLALSVPFSVYATEAGDTSYARQQENTEEIKESPENKEFTWTEEEGDILSGSDGNLYVVEIDEEDGTEETGTGETGTGETGSEETGSEDTVTEETESEETGSEDTVTEETESEETGSEETVSEETESEKPVPDAGYEVIEEAAPEDGMLLLGDGLSYALTQNADRSTYTLTISGTGAMPDYKDPSEANWYAYRKSISRIIVEKGVTSIGDYAFYECSGSFGVDIPSTVKKTGVKSLYGCSVINYDGTLSAWKSIGGPAAVSSSAVVNYKKSLDDPQVSITLSKNTFTYNGAIPKPEVNVKYGSAALINGTHYELIYNSRKDAGSSYVTVRGLNGYTGSVTVNFTIAQKTVANAKVTGVKNLGYTGKKRTHSSLKVKVKLGSSYVTLKSGTDYTLKYYRNKNVSTSSSKAYVIITGKGNYKGSLKKTFRIVRGDPGLKFKKSSLTRTAADGTFTLKASKKAAGSLKLTYTSSKKSVATVNSATGKVTPKKVGTTRITVKSKATKNYKAGSASYKLTIRPLRLSELHYSFSNYTAYEIPLSTFKLFFDSATAKSLYDQYKDGGRAGCCFGLSASSVLMNMAGTGIKPSDFDPNASSPEYFIRYYYMRNMYRYRNTGASLKDIVEALQVTQFSRECSEYLWKRNQNDLAGLIKEVKTGVPVIAAVMEPVYDVYGRQKMQGHALVAYKVRNVSSTISRIYVYDSNYPGGENYITVYKSGNRYTGWSFDYSYDERWSSSNGGEITFISGKTYKSLWKKRKAAAALSQMYISSDNFEIRDANGKIAASMVNGKFTSRDNDIYICYPIGVELKSNVVNLPSGEYRIINKETSKEKLKVTAIDESRSIKIETESSGVTVNMNSGEGAASAILDAGQDESFKVTVLSETPDEDDAKEIVFEGDGNGHEITVGVEDGSIVMDNAGGVILAIDGEEEAYVE